MAFELLEDRRLLAAIDRFDDALPNDSFAQATEVGVGPGVHLENLSLHTATDQDWYKFEVLRSDSIDVNVRFTHADGDLALEIHNANNEPIAASDFMLDDELFELVGLSAGTYYARVFSNTGAENEYSLEIEPNAASPTRVFYVNDGSTTDDFYALAVGNDANSGLLPTEPKHSVRDILDDYDVGPADIIVVDSGIYSGFTEGSFRITQDDEGAIYAGAPLVSSTLARSNLTYGGTRIALEDADANLFYNLGLGSGGGRGIYAFETSIDTSNDNIIRHNVLSANENIRIDRGTGNIVEGNHFQGGSWGVYMPEASSVTIRDNTMQDVYRPIYSYGLSNQEMEAVIEGNKITHSTGGGYRGIEVRDGVASVVDNLISGYASGVWSHQYWHSTQTHISGGNEISGNVTGVEAYNADTVVFGNRIHDNETGLYGYGTFGGTDWSPEQYNDIYDNATGILTLSDNEVRFNRLHHNDIGIRVEGPGGSVHHNVVYRNTSAGILSDGANGLAIVNNTVYADMGDAVLVEGSSRDVELRNNILWATDGYSLIVDRNSQNGFASDYNNLYATGSGKPVHWQKDFADIYDWQVEADYDAHSIGVTSLHPTLDDPQFVNLAGDDFHLDNVVSTSIDAGHPDDLFDQEPLPDGERINLGAYGNTDQAALSQPAYVEVDSPNYYTDWEATERRPILWHTYDVSGRVEIELWKKVAGVPTFQADIAVVDASEGAYPWSPSEAGIVGNLMERYYIKLIALDDPTLTDLSRESFSVPPDSPNFYVDDLSNTSDEYTPAAIGDNRNTGKSPTDPKANLLPILRGYDLGPGDSVMIDTGEYNHVRNTIISGELAQGNDEGVEITGPTDPTRVALIDRDNTAFGSTAIVVNQADFTALRHLTLVGGYDGLLVRNSSTYFTGEDLVVSNNFHDGINVDFNATGTEVARLTAQNNGNYGIYIATPVESLEDSFASDNGYFGIRLSNSGDSLVSNNQVHDNYGGIWVDNYGSGTTRIERNLIFENTSDGIQSFGSVEIVENSIYGHGGSGINIERGAVSDNVIHSNDRGISTSACGTTTVTNNRIYNHTSEGIYATSGDRIIGNVIYSNDVGVFGDGTYCYSFRSFSGTLQNNLIYANSSQAVKIQDGYNAQLINNTLHQVGDYSGDPTAGNVVQIESNSRAISLRNNILWAVGGAALSVADDSQGALKSDYNVFHPDGGVVAFWQSSPRSTLGDWYYTAFTDAHSQQGNPMFVDPSGAGGALGYVDPSDDGRDDDFHVQSTEGSVHGGSLAPVIDSVTGLPVALGGSYVIDSNDSLAIDRGDASDNFFNEPANNGGFINQGAYGNTDQASKSPASYVTVLNPNGSEVWPLGQSFDIVWRSQDATDTYEIDLLQETSPGTFTTVLEIESGYAPSEAEGVYSWTLPNDGSIAPADNYRIQVTRNDTTPTVDNSDTNFAIHAAVTDYYVNDGLDSGTDITTEAGDNAGNTGLSADSPKASIRAILETYDLGPGDTIHVDNGVYDLNVDLLVKPEDGGASGNPLTIKKASGTVLIDRANTFNPVVDVQADFLRLDGLGITGGANGINSIGEGLIVDDSDIFGNSGTGVAASGANSKIINSLIRDNQSTGISVSGEATEVNNNVVLGNAGTGVFISGAESYASENIVSGNDGTGIAASNSSLNASNRITVENNIVRYSSAGITADGNALVSNNTVHANSSTGISLSPAEASGNTVYSNGSTGISTSTFYAGSIVVDNTIYNHSSYGVLTGLDTLVSGNTIYSNGYGIYAYGSSPTYRPFSGRVLNNLVYDHDSSGLYLTAGNGAELSNNTVYQSETSSDFHAALFVLSGSRDTLVRNNPELFTNRFAAGVKPR